MRVRSFSLKIIRSRIAFAYTLSYSYTIAANKAAVVGLSTHDPKPGQSQQGHIGGRKAGSRSDAAGRTGTPG